MMILHEVLTEAQVVVTEQLVEPSIEVGGEGGNKRSDGASHKGAGSLEAIWRRDCCFWPVEVRGCCVGRRVSRSTLVVDQELIAMRVEHVGKPLECVLRRMRVCLKVVHEVEGKRMEVGARYLSERE